MLAAVELVQAGIKIATNRGEMRAGKHTLQLSDPPDASRAD